jgi:D-3-phosphoglycerate dehydrogenase
MPELRVLVTCLPMQRTAGDWLPLLRDRGIEVVLPPVVQHIERAELLRLLPSFDGIIAGDDPLDAEVLAAAVPRLRVVSRWGVGLDSVDLGAARRLGITVTNTPAAFADEVADVALGYLLLLTRKLHEIDAGVRAGGWPKLQGRSFTGRELGLVGLGAIGRAFARRGLALGMRVSGSDPSPDACREAEALGVRVGQLDEVLEQADVVSLHCPMTPENRHLLSRERLGRLRPGVLVINTARGPLVDEAALIDGLRSGAIGGAGLDVFEVEPLPADSELRRLPNVVLGTHNASNTAEAVARVNRLAIDNLLAALAVPA